MQKRSFKVMNGVVCWAEMGVFTALTVCAAGPKPNIVVILADDMGYVIRDGNWKLIATKGSRGFTAERGQEFGIELYNLRNDRSEQNNR